jgi:hypothetical protein
MSRPARSKGLFSKMAPAPASVVSICTTLADPSAAYAHAIRKRARARIRQSWSWSIAAGLKVRAELDENKYPKGVKVSDLSMAAVNLTRHSFHGDWNYTISPHRKTPRKNKK